VKKYKCTCPDFTKTQAANPYAGSLSLMVGRDWSGEGAQLNPPGFCKHIYSVLLYTEEKFEVPTDVPTDREPKPVVERGGRSLNANWKLGDRFD